MIAEPEMFETSPLSRHHLQLFSCLESVKDSMSEDFGPTTAEVESFAIAIGEEEGKEIEERADEIASLEIKSMPPLPQSSLPSLPTEHGNATDFEFAFYSLVYRR